MVERFARFSFAILEISRCWHRVANEAMKQYGLKGAYSVYFTTLSRFPQGVTAVKLVELCGRDKADVSRAMSVLEQKELVQRVSGNNNTYRALLQLTPAGMALADEINEKARAAVEYASRGLAEEKRVIFYEALEMITTNLQDLSREGLPTQSD